MTVPPVFPVACPVCGCEEFEELADRPTWQPVTLEVNDEGVLVEATYQSFDYGDEVKVTGIECCQCEAVWESVAHLQTGMQTKAALNLIRQTVRTLEGPASEAGPRPIRHDLRDAERLLVAALRLDGPDSLLPSAE